MAQEFDRLEGNVDWDGVRVGKCVDGALSGADASSGEIRTPTRRKGVLGANPIF